MNVAIVHDWLNQRGGAETVLETLREMFPAAPVYTSIYWSAAMPESYRAWDIRTTWLDRLPGIHRNHQPFLLLYPPAFAGLELRGYDLVISNKSAFCLGVRTSPGTRHVCYCLTPTRFVWDLDTYTNHEGVGPLARRLVRPFLGGLRRWERAAASRVDALVAISEEVKSRVRRLYGRDSVVIHPPVYTERFATTGSVTTGATPHTPSQHGENAQDRPYFLVVSRLIPYKRIDVAVRAFNDLGLPLWIVGEGRDRPRLEAMARSNVRFLGRVADEDLGGLLAGCRAFLFPGLEDFGIAPVEAMAAGRPVIAFAGGGALETVIEGVSGTFFSEQTPESLAATVRAFDERAYAADTIRAHARQFDVSVFKTRLRAFLEEEIEGPWN